MALLSTVNAETLRNIGYLLKRTYKPEVIARFRQEAEEQGAVFLGSEPVYIHPRNFTADDKRIGLRIGFNSIENALKAFSFERDCERLAALESIWDYSIVQITVSEDTVKRLTDDDAIQIPD